VPAKKPGLTVDEHKALGAELHAMRTRLMHLYVESTHKYPKNSPVARHLAGSFNRLDQARSALDDCLAREHPADFDTRTYYPGGGATGVGSPGVSRHSGGKATFVSWLASHVGEDSPIGDLARDAVADSQFPDGSSDERETYEEHLQTMGAADVAMNAFDDAWGRYVRVGA
jgi:uncharacterized protein YozE (UPF0346 family)